MENSASENLRAITVAQNTLLLRFASINVIKIIYTGLIIEFTVMGYNIIIACYITCIKI